MGYRGSGYFGSPSLQTSTSNQEIIQQHKPSEWTVPLKAYKFSFVSDQNCTVKINNGNPIFRRAGQIFNMNEVDALIYSFVIVEADITYNYEGCY